MMLLSRPMVGEAAEYKSASEYAAPFTRRLKLPGCQKGGISKNKNQKGAAMSGSKYTLRIGDLHKIAQELLEVQLLNFAHDYAIGKNSMPEYLSQNVSTAIH